MNTLMERLSEEEHKSLYHLMVLCREFEERSAEMYTKGKIRGFTHLYTGEEAVAVGAITGLHPDDYVISAYRDHAHCLVKGVDSKKVMAELFGRSTGTSSGKGGSMHLFDLEKRFLGGYAIVGAGLPIACGVGFAIRYLERNNVVACFFGDGATNTGSFHESLNMAKIWNLPIIFICENNFYGIGTYVEWASAVKDLYKKGKAYDIPSEQVDGMDVLKVREAVEKAAQRAREDLGPYFIEAVTYRFRGHSMSDPGDYRARREEKIWKERDPIINYAKLLVSEAIAAPEELEEIKEKAIEGVEEAITFAENSPWPQEQDLFKDVYSDD